MVFKNMKKGIFSILFLISCSIKPNISSEMVQKGKNLEKIPLVSLDEFFQLWLRNQKYPKMAGINFEKFFEDKEFQYFGKKEWNRFIPISKWRFFKIQKEILNREFPNYEFIFSQDFSGRFQNQVLPESDRKFYLDIKAKVIDKEDCIDPYQYSYSLVENKIVLTIKWNVESCEELILLKDKIYQLVYNLRKKQFEE
ncbi:putative lipoprotein [Leptospira interrogans str. L1207]|nr:putative lipoprotein [Leptospira interrogans str. L1207]